MAAWDFPNPRAAVIAPTIAGDVLYQSPQAGAGTGRPALYFPRKVKSAFALPPGEMVIVCCLVPSVCVHTARV